MKTIIFVIAILFFDVVQAETEIICTAVNEDPASEMTVVISFSAEIPNLKIYRSFHGHTFPRQEQDVQSLKAAKGPVLAYGNESQTLTLVMNLLERTAENKVIGHFLDMSVSDQPVRVICAL